MENSLKDKTIVLTGAARNIGFEIAKHFLKNEAKKVIILDIIEIGDQAVKTLNDEFGEKKAVFYKCNVTKDVESVFKKIMENNECIDVLVNCAGIFKEAFVRKTIEINLLGTIEFSMKFWNYMRKDRGGKGGTIINIASILGFRVFSLHPVYTASKFGIVGFTKSLGEEHNYKKTGVRVIGICPGLTITDMVLSEDIIDNSDLALLEEERKLSRGIPQQDAAAVGKATVEVFVKGDSGTIWLSEGGNPPEKVELSATYDSLKRSN